MGQVLRFPAPSAALDRIVARDRAENIAAERAQAVKAARDRAENIAAERAQAVKAARAVLRSPETFPDTILRDACAALQVWGDATDYMTADAMIFALNRRDRMRAHEEARRAVETPAEVAAMHAHRWLAIIGGGALIAALMLAGTGWL